MILSFLCNFFLFLSFRMAVIRGNRKAIISFINYFTCVLLANGTEDFTKQQKRRKGRQNWTCTGVTFVSCHEFSLQVRVQIYEVLLCIVQSKWKK